MTRDTGNGDGRSIRDRHRVLRALVRGEERFGELERATGLAPERLRAALGTLRDQGHVERRTTELETLDTDYRCSQELTGTRAPAQHRYALTPTGVSVRAAVAKRVCTPV